MTSSVDPSTPAQTARVAVLFDIDGTLVDSNYLHIDAWSRAFAAVGHPVEAWRIHRAIGMDSGKMLDDLLEGDADTLGAAAKEEHAHLYEAMADRMRALPRARDLVRELAARGHTVVFATSAPGDELDLLLRLLDVSDAVDVVTSGDDVDAAKPDPDIIGVALRRASVSADRAIMIGDSVWDVEAAGRAGVPSIGVLSGGYGEQELLDAGAAAVYPDAAALLDALDSSPIYPDRLTRGIAG